MPDGQPFLVSPEGTYRHPDRFVRLRGDLTVPPTMHPRDAHAGTEGPNSGGQVAHPCSTSSRTGRTATSA
ncbi:hypothetical protein [Streptomyces sp. NPDC005476]|uniref:hypothetical protein n=1 Tax=Streptomyces sp. NPDC005476 TaxID=3156882 RepID=UPI0034515170